MRPDPSQAPTSSAHVMRLRFSLRKMFVLVAVLCVLLAVLSAVEGLLALGFLLMALVIGAHVASTSVGTRLRDGATTQLSWQARHGSPQDEPNLAVDLRHTAVTSAEPPVACRLQQRGPAVAKLALLVTAGSFLGAASSLALMLAMLWSHIGLAAILAGTAAGSILGAWIAFLACSFWGTTRGAWREALEAPSKRTGGVPSAVVARTAPDSI